MNKVRHQYKTARQRGQSLVEVALALPIFIILIAGVVEVSNILVTKNRIETAARAAARFAADGGENIEDVAINTVTQTLDISSGVWDIFLIEGTVEDDGNSFSTWDVTHLYGDNATTTFTEVNNRLAPSCTTNCIQDEVLAELQTNDAGVRLDPNVDASVSRIAANLDVIGVVLIHDINSILGLNALPAFSDIMTVDGLGVMRQAAVTSVVATDGCTSAIPLVFDRSTRDVTEGEYNLLTPTYPLTLPSLTALTNFTPRSGDVPIDDANEGYVYLLRANLFRFAWAKWNPLIDSGPTTLANSLDWSTAVGRISIADYSDRGDSGVAYDPPGWVVRGFVEVGNTNDRSLHVNDRLAADETPGMLADNAVQAAIRNHIDNDRVLRINLVGPGAGIPTFDGLPAHYIVDDFGLFKIHAFGTDNNGWILAEFVGIDTSCGQ